jgi:radical SAM protein with 4Fe4S-binding SPASM domain
MRPWLLVREEDSVLIVPPNRVYKLGGSALALSAYLDSGGRLADLPGSDGRPGLDEARALEILRFFEELRAAYEGRAPASSGAGGDSGFGRITYDFAFTRLPILGEVALTYRCNERCRFCYAGCGSNVDTTELTTEQWKRIIRMLKEDAKIPFFSFTGGEPLLRPDLEALASYARSLGLRTNLITNGSLASTDRAASLKAAGVDTAQVSLESPDSEIHDALCGVEGAWKRTIAGIGALRAAGISVQTNTTLTAVNRDSLAALPAFLASLGVERFSMNLFIPAGRGLEEGSLFIPYTEVGGVIDRIRREAHKAGRTFFWYSPTPYCLYNPVARGLGNKSCAAMDGLVHINPRGEILPCSSWSESLGSVLEKKFTDIWFSERALYFKHKQFAPRICEGCSSFVACQGACPLYWRAQGADAAERELGTARGRACCTHSA